jgi:hypothetical protein
VASGGVREPLYFFTINPSVKRRCNLAEPFRKFLIFISDAYKEIWRPQGESKSIGNIKGPTERLRLNIHSAGGCFPVRICLTS